MNKAILVGRICKDVELKYSKNGKANIDFAIAIPRTYKNEEGIYETDFINIVAWGNIAENTASYCKKGDLIGVSGSLRHDIYETENGKKYKDYILAEKISYLTSYKGE